jgi:hypothetical protein
VTEELLQEVIEAYEKEAFKASLRAAALLGR